MNEDPVLPATRALAVAIAPFLVVAFAVLYPFPGDTGRLFAWRIAPAFTSMLLGSVYLGGAYYFVRVAVARRWSEVAAGFPPVAIFATLLGVATVLHWDRFAHGHPAFWLWTGLYFTTPWLVVAAWVAQGSSRPPLVEQRRRLPAAVVALGAGIAGLALLTAGTLYAVPGFAQRIWPWPLTPLTSRVVAAVFSLGVGAITATRRRMFEDCRVLLQAAAVMAGLIAIAVVRAHGEFLAGRPLTWLLAGGSALTAAAGFALFRRAADDPA